MTFLEQLIAAKVRRNDAYQAWHIALSALERDSSPEALKAVERSSLDRIAQEHEIERLEAILADPNHPDWADNPDELRARTTGTWTGYVH